MPPEEILKWLMQSGAFWCIILIRLSLKKVPYVLFIIKYIDYSYTTGNSVAVGYFAPRETLKTCSS